MSRFRSGPTRQAARRTRRSLRVVLAGRPNVGKSTLFNRLSGTRRAIVAPVAGTTRDLITAPVEWEGASFELVDTGGLFGASEDPLQDAVSAHGLRALDGADLILLLVDARDGLVPADREVADRVRRGTAEAVLVVNKIDDRKAAAQVEEFHGLGFPAIFPVAAEHGTGVGDLLDEVARRLPGARRPREEVADDEAETDTRAVDEIAVAVVGRPNVGKSSLVNLLAREERVLVSDLAGTTRDAVDTVLRWQGRSVRLVDTAGIRRPGQVARAGQVESVSVTLARRAMQRADVAVVLLDASRGVTHRDAAIAGEAERAGCGVILAANKWDLVQGSEEGFAEQFDSQVRRTIKFADYAPIIRLSALTGSRAPKVLETAAQVAEARSTHVATVELNRFLERVTKRHPPTSSTRREVKLQYATQTGIRPPRFLIFTSTATALHFSYERFLVNRLREEFGFLGSPIRLRIRANRRPSRRRPRG